MKDPVFLGHYPGDAYVDIVAMDGYNWGITQSWGSTCQSFDQIYANCYKIMCQVDKPILITEMSSTETGGNKAQLNVATCYESIRGITIGSMVKYGYRYYVNLTFSDSYLLKAGAGSINIQTRIIKSGWSSVENFKEGNLLVLYGGQVVK